MRGAAGGVSALAAVCVVAFAAAAPAATLLGATFADGVLHDVDAATGTASNPRPVAVGATPVNFIAGIDFDAAGTLFAITSESPNPVPNFPSTLFRVDPATGAATVVAALDEKIAEGDLTLDPASGDLLAFARPNGLAAYRLIRIDPATGATSLIGEVADLGIDPSGLAMTAGGTLYALDTAGDALLRLDLADASIDASSAISPPLGNVAGMDFDPASGFFYVADGGGSGTNSLYTLDPVTGDLDAVGATGLANGLGALAVPEPGALARGVAGAAALAVIAARRSARLS